MHLGIQRTSLGRITKGRDRFRMPPLPRKGDAQVERRVGVVTSLEHGAKSPLGFGEFLLL